MNKDSIENLSYLSIEQHFSKSFYDSITDVVYANAYLKKAKHSNDTLRIATAYYYFSKLFGAEKGLKYSDSIIQFTKNVKGHKKFPLQGYLKKGIYLADLGEYKEGIDYYLIAQKYAEENQDTLTLAAIKVGIVTLKLDLGEKVDFLPPFRNYVTLLRRETDSIKDRDNYTQSLSNLALIYMHYAKYDSANIVIKEGIERTLEKGDTLQYIRFLVNIGVSLNNQKKYKQSIDSLIKVSARYDLKDNYPYVNRIIGNCYYELGDIESANIYYIKVDSFITNDDAVTQRLLDIYPKLINYYAKKNDYKQQLYYTNNLLRLDSIIDSNRNYISKEINEKYDIPELLKSKQVLILKLEKEKKRTLLVFGIVVIIFCLILLIAFTLYRLKIRKLKKRFEELIANLKKEKPKPEIQIPNNSQSKDLQIQDELINSIIKKLENFERQEKFIRKDCTMHNLAKEFKTNYVYLSKIINEHKGMNFSNYLNNLRIDYAINKLYNDEVLRSYTIQAISEEVGFKTAQSFSTAFYRKTGMKPSYFLKNLKQEKNKA